MSVRRVRVAEWEAAGVALGSGLVVATASGARPTADPWSDAVVLAAAVGVVCWSAASAPWRALAGAAAIGLGGAASWWAAVAGIVGVDTVVPVEGAVPLADGYHLVVVDQPLAVASDVDVVVTDPAGDVLAEGAASPGIWRTPNGAVDDDPVRADEVATSAGAPWSTCRRPT